MKVLVSGATGVVGQEFLDLHSDKFKSVYFLGRTPPSQKGEFIFFDFHSDNPPKYRT